MTQQATLLVSIIDIAQAAGREVRQIYENEATRVTEKADGSPLTQADLASQKVIAARLAQLTPDIPLISEEKPLPDFAERQQWSQYWLVDPLDGTKEFVGRTGEFTVNIALIKQGQPVLGVVVAPMLDTTYAACEGAPAKRIDHHGDTIVRVRRLQSKLRLVVSRRHKGGKLGEFRSALEQQFDDVERCDVGSSLKICQVAEGSADIYPRFGPTSEWDTAAADAVLRAAGGALVQRNMQPLQYNKRDILNPDFMAIGELGDWQQLPALWP